MAGAVGFGSGPDDRGPAGVDVQEPIGSPEDQFIDDIHQIKRKYVDGGTNLKVPLGLAANTGLRTDMTGLDVNSIILTGATGVIFGYLGDQSSLFNVAALAPDFCVSAGVVPTTIQIMVPLRNDYVICFQEGAGSAATGTARLMKI